MLERLAPLFLLCAAAACSKKTESSPRAEVTKPVVSAAPDAAQAPGSQADALTLNADLGSVAIPEDNPQTDEKVVLGRQLFFDKRLSADGSRSCYSCHQNEDGNGGHEPIAIG